MQTYSSDTNTVCALADHDLDVVSGGGFVYIGVAVGFFALGTAISTGAVTGDVIELAKKYGEQKKGSGK